jgi:acetylornithine deacetylase/succinyl-diaminopimelate desuccinylase-like protein
LRDADLGVDCAIVFDSLMADERTPAISVGARGLVQASIEVRTGARDLHSGLYGGAVLNAAHVLLAMLAALTPDREGLVREELRAGVAPVSDRERESWGRLEPGSEALRSIGAREVTPGAGNEFYERIGAAPALDVNLVSTGEPRTIVPSVARGHVSLRLAPGQSAAVIGPEFERLLLSAVPEGAEVEMEMELADPAPAFVRLGGTLPLLAVLAERGVPTIVSGFVLPDDAIHAPDESYRLESLRLGERSARELYAELAGLPRA